MVTFYGIFYLPFITKGQFKHLHTHLYLCNCCIFFVAPGVTVTRLEATVGHPTKRSWSHCGCKTLRICYGPGDAELASEVVQLVFTISYITFYFDNWSI